VWAGTDELSAVETAAFARRVEAWGYGHLWIPEAVGREVFSASSWLLANTTRLVIASGIANIYARDPLSAAAAQKGLNEQSAGRFLLGLGVSHIPLVEGVRHHNYGKPVATMRAYLRAMKEAPYRAVAPAAAPKTVLAALGPKMLELAGAEADGAHPYNVSPEHTRQARALLGPEKLLCVSKGRFSRLIRPGPGRSPGGFWACIWDCLTTSITGGGLALRMRTSRPVVRIA